jgi:hypothetical protein
MKEEGRRKKEEGRRKKEISICGFRPKLKTTDPKNNWGINKNSEENFQKHRSRLNKENFNFFSWRY